MRYRLRFLLQELDLRPGVTMLGRSSECHITIEDPLVSREHATIEVDHSVVTVRDLGSRNGVKVNGVVIRERVSLHTGDRIRIGTQEFVFTAVAGQHASNRTTGFLRHCARCRMPYSEEAGTCPSCGSSECLEETLTAKSGSDAKGWELTLLVEMIDRALSLERADDAERLLSRASAEVEQYLGRNQPVTEETLTQLTVGIARVSFAANGGPTWACWLILLFRRLPFAPSETMRQELARLLQVYPQEVGEALEELRGHYLHQPTTDPVQLARRQGIERLCNPGAAPR